MEKYDYKKIEPKWQAKWRESGIYKTKEEPGKPKCYVLDMFPYPSGDGLHVGHPKGYIATDVFSRFHRMSGHRILHPMGWDAFGLPAENYAIKNKVHPRAAVEKNIARFKQQLEIIGFDYDWEREINTTDPEYYRWTQWIFLKLFEKGLAYESHEPINWCPSCQTGLANEDLENGKCERCGSVVEKKPLRQWVLRITDYADRMLADLDDLDWPRSIKESQRNWIGRSEGAEIEFKISPTPLPLPEGEGEMPNYLILHGYTGRADKNFIPWLKKSLEERGFKAQAPQLPDTDNPKESEQVEYVIKNCQIDENTIIIGHSLGALVAMKLLQKINKPIAGLVLVAAAMEPGAKKNADDEERPFWQTFSWDINYEKLKKLTKKRLVISDLQEGEKENGRTVYLRQLSKKLEADLIEANARRIHFCAEKESVILDSLLNEPSPLGREGWGYETADPKIYQILQEKALEMRKNPTKAEEILWQELRDNSTDFHFRRQHIIDRFIVDFVCLEKKLVVEVDGDIHDYQKEADTERTEFLESAGFKVLRFTNEEILDDVEAVKTKIAEEFEALSFGEGLGGASIKVFTTRADTLFGVTYVVLAPESPLVTELWSMIKNQNQVQNYLLEVKNKTEIERTAEGKGKTGVQLEGVYAVNPANNEKVPIWVADYVLASYGTGAVMAVPAHDERDYIFAKKYKQPIKNVVIPSLIDSSNPPRSGKKDTFRNMVLGIVYDPKAKKYLTLKWKTQPWVTFVTGGVEDGESRLEAIKREILEETGYKNIRLVRSLGMTEAFFFAAHKDVNRQTHGEHFLFELENYEQAPILEEERNQYDLNWLSAEELCSVHLQHVEADILWSRIQTGNDSYMGEGVLVESGIFDGLNSQEAREKIAEKFGEKKVTYKLRDWVFSRQRYWGEPIPIIHCEKCGAVPVPEQDLPVKLPEVEHYEPTGTGESPLANIAEWVNVPCPKCGGAAKRETNTMPQWAGSSWYYLRYQDPKNDTALVAKDKEKYWSPVDMYVGGAEHATRHLIYARFWHKFLFDLGVVNYPEPFKRLQNVGLIQAEDGRKMSKRYGNVVNPDDIVERYGADTLRVYEMFMGPFDQAIAWNTEGLMGPRRFLERVWKLHEKVASPVQDSLGSSETIPRPLENFAPASLIHQTIKKVGEDIEALRFNTAISSLMILVNAMEAAKELSRESYEILLRLLAPFAPHLSEELWQSLGHETSIHLAAWPSYDAALARETQVNLAVQVNGVLRDTLPVSLGLAAAEAERLARASAKVSRWLEGKTVKKVVYVPGRILNFVV